VKGNVGNKSFRGIFVVNPFLFCVLS
jgi:hypothetical protein